MPRSKPALKASPLVQEAEVQLREPSIPLSLEEREAFRAAIKSPAFQKALRNIRNQRPSVFTHELNSALGASIANNRLHEIRGWELFEGALWKQSQDPVIAAPQARENYQDESKHKPT